ncbi:MAG: heavy metal translocating P-type ATPase [Chloroflexota bacterium]
MSILSMTIPRLNASKVFTIKYRKRPRLIEGLRPCRYSDINNDRPLQISTLTTIFSSQSEAEKNAFASLQLASLGVMLGVAGLLLPPLQIAGILCLAPTLAKFFKAGFRTVVKERRVSGEVVVAIYLATALAGGFLVQLNVGGWLVVLVQWLVIKTEDQSKQKIIDLFEQRVRSVWVVVDGQQIEIPVEQVEAGDLIVGHAGQVIPMDGVIVDGYASIDQRSLTGEAQPVEKGPGDQVLATTNLLAGRIYIQVEKAGQETVAAQIGQALVDTTEFKANLVSRATTFNDQIALPYLMLSGLTLTFLGLTPALAILAGTPGYRMMLYGPLSMLSYLHLAAQQSILIKDGRSLELLKDVNTVVFDKTGTLTMEQPSVSCIVACNGFSKTQVLAYAAAAETKQSHPVARAILEEAEQQVASIPIDHAEYEIGYGVHVKLNDDTVRVGSQRFMQIHEIDTPSILQNVQTKAHSQGNSIVFVAINNIMAGAIVLQPSLRPELQNIIAQLRERDMQLYIMSGDHDAPTRNLAQKLEMDGYFADVLPEDKANLVAQLQSEGRNVCFVGDGINDSIALKSANVSVSLHGATTIATDIAQIVLMDGNLSQLPQIFKLADEFRNNMRVNFYAATTPSIIITTGALFFGLGLLPAIVLNNIPVPFALYNTIRPLITEQQS